MECETEVEASFCPQCGQETEELAECEQCGALHAEGGWCVSCEPPEEDRADTMMNCAGCGAFNDEGDEFCTECGDQL